MADFICDLCGCEFKFKFELISHFQDHKNGLKINIKAKKPVDKEYKCSVCQKSFTRKESYTNHDLWHSGKSPHKCFVCGKSFTRKSILENHQKIHSYDHSSEPKVRKIIVASFSCDYCAKRFTRKENLKAHISIHTGESKHKCSYCDKLFTRKQNKK